MEILVLDTNLQAVSVLDTFESLIWTDRYQGYGDFEIYDKASLAIKDNLQQDYYLWSDSSDRVMIIEDCQINEDAENGDHMVFTGRSLESILDRRIIWSQTVLTGNLQNGIKKLLDENIISPTITNRAIPNFIFQVSTDPAITSLTVDAQFTGDNLYDAILKLCTAANIAFKITLSDSNQFIFQLYVGTDRSYDQLINPYIIFSPNFENIINSNYSESKKSLKNVSLVAGEGEGSDRKTTSVGSGIGMSRREMFTDAREISQTVDGVLISDATYLAQLAQKGNEDLSQNIITQTFDSKVDTTKMFKYGEDFFIGDIVQIVSDYGIESKAQVKEFIQSQNESGIDTYPTFTIIN